MSPFCFGGENDAVFIGSIGISSKEEEADDWYMSGLSEGVVGDSMAFSVSSSS